MFKNLKILLLFWIAVVSSASYAQVINTWSFALGSYPSFSYNQKDSSFILYQDKALQYKSPTAQFTIPGNLGYFSQGGRHIYSIEFHDSISDIRKFDKTGKLLKQISINDYIRDLAISSTRIYALNRYFSNLKSEDNSSIYVLDKELRILTKWETNLPYTNSVNISCSENRQQLIIGAGIQGAYLNTKGDLLKNFNTAHGSLALHHHNCHSILHYYSDGSYIDFIFSDSSKTKLEKILEKEYSINGGIKTRIASFSAWDINRKNDLIITLDHSKEISIYTQKGELLKNLIRSKDIGCIFFSSDHTLAYYDLRKRKLIFIDVGKYAP